MGHVKERHLDVGKGRGVMEMFSDTVTWAVLDRLYSTKEQKKIKPKTPFATKHIRVTLAGLGHLSSLCSSWHLYTQCQLLKFASYFLWLFEQSPFFTIQTCLLFNQIVTFQDLATWSPFSHALCKVSSKNQPAEGPHRGPGTPGPRVFQNFTPQT